LNSCTNIKIKAYFQDGTLPGSDNFCPLEAGPFGVVLSGGLEKRTDYIDIRDRMKRLLKFWAEKEKFESRFFVLVSWIESFE
jgi:hypothetical protein